MFTVFLHPFHPPAEGGEDNKLMLREAANQGTVLIVEDSDTCAVTLEIALLEMPGLAVEIVPNAVQALAYLRRCPSPLRALVTDLNLPQMDGYQLIERVRSDERHSRVPIIVVSGDPDPRTAERVRKAGGNAYFAKPYSPAMVRRKLEQLLDGDHS